MVMSLWPHFLAYPVRLSKPTRRLALIETLRYRIYRVDPETTRSNEFCHCSNVYLRTLSAWVSTLVNYRARASEEGNDIGRVRPSVSLFFRPLFFRSNFWTAWPLTLDCFMFMDYDQWPYSSLGIKNQGHTSRSKVKGWVSRDGSAVGLTSILDRRQFLNRVAWTQCMDADYCYRCLCVCCWSQQKKPNRSRCRLG